MDGCVGLFYGPPVLAAIYCRISDDRDGTGLGVARQEKACRELCARAGWEVAAVHVDNDISAYRGKKRPGYEALLDGVKNGDYQAVVCWHPDRLHRRPIELEHFIDVIELSGAEVATVTAGSWDLSTPSGRAVARTVGAWARYESEHKAERQRAKHDELFLSGRPAGGDRCFGFGDDNITHVPEQVEAIRWAAQHLLDGGSLRSVCSTWNDGGLPTTFGNQWQPWVVKRLLCSAKVGGKRERDGMTVDAVWQPILPWETVQRLRAVLNDPGRRRNHHQRRYLLTGGIAVCGIEGCGKPLIARPRGDGARCYVCASGPGFYGCGKIRCLADPLEADVERRLLARLRSEELPEPTSDSAPLVALLDRLEAQQAELAVDFYSERTITRGEFTAASASLMEKIGKARKDIAQAEVSHRATGDRWQIAADYRDSGFDEKRAVVRGWIDKVVVGPAVRGRNFYDDGRVQVTWLD